MNFPAIALSSLAVVFACSTACSGAPDDGTPKETNQTFPVAAGECSKQALTLNGVLGDRRVVVLDDSGGYSLSGSWEPGTFLELSGSKGDVVGLQLTGDLTKSPTSPVFGWLALPEGAQKDAGAFYCAGAGSKISADLGSATSPTTKDIRVELAALTRLGTCDEAAEDLPGEVSGCMAGSEDKSCENSITSTVPGPALDGYSMSGSPEQFSVGDGSGNVTVAATTEGNVVKRAVLFLHSGNSFTLACARTATITPSGDSKRFSFSGFKKLGSCGESSTGNAGSMLICRP
jgi:hypothetical protein